MNRGQRVLLVIGMFVVLTGLAWNLIPSRDSCERPAIVTLLKHPSDAWAASHPPPRAGGGGWFGDPPSSSCVDGARRRLTTTGVPVGLGLIGVVLGLVVLRTRKDDIRIGE